MVGPPAHRRSYGRLRSRGSVRARLGGGFRCDQPGFELLAEPIALSFDVDGARMVEQAIQNGRRDDRIAKDLAPGAQALIARQDDGTPFIATGDELEEQVRPLPINRDIADLINDEEVGLGEEPELVLQPILG